MELIQIKNKGQAQLFKNALLENMTKTHPLVIYSMYLPVMITALYFGAAYKHVGIVAEMFLFVGGAFAWSLFEYFMHRSLFHMIVERPRFKKVIYTIHGVHHEFPRDRERLFMPLVPSLIIASILFSIFYLVMGWYALAFFAGFLFGYLLYGSMHYAIHSFAPPKYMKALWRNHHLHHYKQDSKGFGVSSVLWDIVFGTVPQRENTAPVVPGATEEKTATQ